jgi:hypothetical protein
MARRPQLLIWAAWLLHLAAWFLPVVKEGVTLPEGLPGWQAFRVAASPVWPLPDVTVDAWYKTVLFAISAVTTLLFIPGSVWTMCSGSRTLRQVSPWIATFAFVVNAHWYVLYGSARNDLRIGYFVWWLSFLLLAVGLFGLSRREAGQRQSSKELQ